MGTRFLWLVGINEADLCAKFWAPGGLFWYRKSHLKFFTKRGKKGCYLFFFFFFFWCGRFSGLHLHVCEVLEL